MNVGRGYMTKRLALSMVCACMLLTVGASADPSYRNGRYCLTPVASDRWKPSRHRIDIRLHESLLDICGGHSASCQAGDLDAQRFKIERAVRTALADFHNAAGANLRFELRRWTSSARLRDDTIVLAHFRTTFDGACPLDKGIALANHERQPWYLAGDDRGRVLFCTRMMDGQRVRWLPWSEGTESGERLGAFIPVVKHELLHVLGLSHSTQCTPPIDIDAINARVMRASGFTFKHLAREDIRFLRDHFGHRRNRGHVRVSSSGDRWSQAGAAPSEATDSMGRPAAVNSFETTKLFVGWRDTSEETVRFSLLTPRDGAWRVRSSVESPNAPYALALAGTSDTRFVLVTLAHDAGLSSAALRSIVRASENGGESWTSAFELPDSNADVPGVAATHDPATHQWLILTAGRQLPGRGWRIRYQSIGAGHVPHDLGVTVTTADVPSIACGPRDETNPANCLLAWQSDRWEGGIEWTQCRANVQEAGVLLDCAPTRQLGYVSVSGTALTDAGSGDGFPWQVPISQSGASLYTARVAAKVTRSFGANASLSAGLSYEGQSLFHPIVNQVFVDFDGPGPAPPVEVFSLLIDIDHRDLGAMVRYDRRMGRHDLLFGLNYGDGSVQGGNYRNLNGRPNGISEYVDNTADSVEAFVVDRWHASDRWTVVFGGQTVSAGRDVVTTNATTGAIGNPSARYSSFNPRAGVIAATTHAGEVYGNVSRLFEAPTTFQMMDDVRGGNATLDPMSGIVAEVGWRSTSSRPSGTRWSWDVTAYFARISDEILSVDDPSAPGNTLVTNIDKTTHAGLEAFVGSSFMVGGANRIEPRISLTLNRFHFDDDQSWGTNRLPAAPTYAARGEVLYRHDTGFYVGPTFDLIGERYADFANSYTVEGYQLMGLRAGMSGPRWEMFGEVRNLFDREYIATLGVLNVAGSDARVLYPGALSAYTGLRCSF